MLFTAFVLGQSGSAAYRVCKILTFRFTVILMFFTMVYDLIMCLQSEKSWALMERKGKEILVLSVRPSLSISLHLFWGPGSFSFNTESKQTSQRGKIMAVNIPFFLHSPLSVPSFRLPLPLTAFPSSSFYSPVSRIRISCCCSSSPLMDPLPKFKELPFVPASQRDLMLDLVSTLETRLSSSLLPCSLPPDVQYYRNQNGTAEGSLYIRSGVPSSPVLSFSLSLSHFTSSCH